MLDQIVEQIRLSEDQSPPQISERRVHIWMSSDDPEVLGATYELLMNGKHAGRITPPLEFDDVFEFLIRYYDFCLRKNPRGSWVDDRFSASCEFVRVFVSFWDERRDKKYFDEMKSLLSRLYTEGPGELKDSIEQAIVEHLFEREEIREFFSDWQDNPQLQPAYEAGKLWAEGGGRSPLTQPRRQQP